MWDRRFLFSNDQVIATLKTSFVPVVGNTHELQNRRSEVGSWFMSTVAKVNPRVNSGNTSQGFYVVAPDGKAYGFNNNRSVDRVLDFMQRGLASYKADPPEQVAISQAAAPVPQPPAGTSVIRVYSRILPLPSGCHDSNANVQRDHFWVLPEEVRALNQLQVPDSFRLRLSRFALVDAIRGEPDFWRREEVVASDLKVERQKSGELKLTGRFSMRTADGKRGLEGSLEAALFVNGDQISGMKGFFDGTAWGQSTYTPNPPPGRFPLKFAFVPAPQAADTVAPQAAMFGREYLGR